MNGDRRSRHQWICGSVAIYRMKKMAKRNRLVYHRQATTNDNQTLETMVRQVHNAQMWGRVTLNNAILAVKAKHGPLPDGVDGVEFETQAVPTPGCSTRSEVFWYANQETPDVHIAAEGGEDYCYIEVAIRKVVYRNGKHLKDGVHLTFKTEMQ